jgi:ribosome-binding protein aMBF1 (putative translation factor)
MPETQVFFFEYENGEISVHAWLLELAEKDAKAVAACIAKIRLLAACGHELRRPHADYLRDGIYELRAKRGRVNYRVLYFFHATAKTSHFSHTAWPKRRKYLMLTSAGQLRGRNNMNRIQTSTKQPSRSRKTRTTSDALEIIDKTIVGDNSELRQLVEEATLNALVAGAIHDARKAAGLTQGGLARLIGTKQPVISQLENADYQGHSLSMLKRIADALDQRLEIRFMAKDAEPKPMTT